MFRKVYISMLEYTLIYTILNTMVRESMLHVNDRTLGVYTGTAAASLYIYNALKFPSLLAANYDAVLTLILPCA